MQYGSKNQKPGKTHGLRAGRPGQGTGKIQEPVSEGATDLVGRVSNFAGAGRSLPDAPAADGSRDSGKYADDGRLDTHDASPS